MIAAALFTIVAAAIVSSFTTTLTSIERSREQAEVSQMARLAMERMVIDLTSAFFVSNDERYQFAGRGEPPEDRDGPLLSFVTVSHQALPGSGPPGGFARVEYFIGPGPNGDKKTILYRSETSVLANGGKGARAVAPLCEGVRGLRLEYYDAAGARHDGWNTAEVEGERLLPVAVWIRLSLGRADPGQVFTTVVPIP